MRPDPAASYEKNREAMIDVAQKFRECATRQSKLVGWFDR